MRKTAGAILTFVAFAGIPQVEVIEWPAVPGVLDFTPRKLVVEPEVEQEMPGLPPGELENLDDFYAALRRTERGEHDAVTRIVHFGDSPTTGDLITADVRAALQKRFGDAGHGYCLIAKPWAWYAHRGVRMSASGWEMDPATRADLRHGLFGLGGVMFGGRPGAQARFTLDDARHGSIELAYLVQPGGGSITVTAGETVLGEIGTDGPVTASGYATFALPPGAQTVEIQVTSGYVRLFGIRFDKPGPGIVYNSLGLNGAHVTVLSRAIREHHLAEQLRHYAPDLVIVNYGTNESIYSEYVERELARELKEALRRVRAAAPKASILVMSPMDRGERQEDGEIGTPPALERLIAIEEAVSRESDCAFFNTFRAMGGHGTMGRWYHAQPRLVGGDFIHPTPAGASIVGRLLAHSLMTGYNRYKLRQLRLARN